MPKRTATFAIDSNGETEVLKWARLLPYANKVFARRALTFDERMVIHVVREVRCPLRLVGLDTTAISNRQFAP